MPSVPLMSARPSFSASTTGARPAWREGLGRHHPGAAAIAHVALAHQGERDVGQRRQVARAAERAELVHDRRDGGVEQRGSTPGPSRAHARDAAAEVGQARDHHRAHHLGLDLVADAGGVAADQRALQVASLGRAR
jgi:hypothetical protein